MPRTIVEAEALLREHVASGHTLARLLAAVVSRGRAASWGLEVAMPIPNDLWRGAPTVHKTVSRVGDCVNQRVFQVVLHGDGDDQKRNLMVSQTIAAIIINDAQSIREVIPTAINYGARGSANESPNALGISA
ncbi:unnamed protein product [Ilex paraguariensis]|uniref:Uncharacterized protein n=1 Tax=Ilex paraguariensis TaxID=185542 RepID=A0ABC8U5V4_9AQUA